MKAGGTLEIDAPISPRILRMQPEYQAIQRAWSRDWKGRAILEEVSVSAPARDEPEPERKGRVGAFFSGGVDSWSTIVSHPEITDLVFIRGADLLLGDERHEGLVEEVDARLRAVAAELGKRITVVETNLRRLSDPLAPWEIYFGCALVSVALFAQPLFDRVLIASEIDHEVQPAVATARMVDHLWSTDGLEIIDDGGLYNRVERIRNIADHPLVQRSLRSCWQNPGSAYNCGRCRKCLQTMITLEALGKRDRVSTFPELDLGAVADVVIDFELSLSLWEDLLDLTRATGRSDLEQVVAPAVERGKRALGLPSQFRRRRVHGPPPLTAPPQANGSSGSTRPADAEQLLGTILSSRSWRLTEPLRRLGAWARRARAPRP